MRNAFFARLLSVSLLLGASVAVADPTPDPRAAELARRFESPFCPGRTLDECTSPAAAAWRTDIRQWVEEGVSSEEIERRLEERAGRDLDMVPDAGVSLTMVALVAFLGLGAAALVRSRLLRRKQASEATITAAPTVAAVGDDYERALDDELALLD
jgi:cytochrome c-type biogenesis protein CcmH/NrfF